MALARELDCALLLDEFYSHYVWTAPAGRLPIESAARYVEDVNRDPVVLFDGLTKNWRYPGWRTTWTIGPRQVIDAVASAGSFLDGGGSKPLQRAAIPLLDDAHVIAETEAIHARLRRQARPHAGRPGPPRRSRPTAPPTARSTSGAASTSCRRRSTTAWASSARRSTTR